MRRHIFAIERRQQLKVGRKCKVHSRNALVIQWKDIYTHTHILYLLWAMDDEDDELSTIQLDQKISPGILPSRWTPTVARTREAIE